MPVRDVAIAELAQEPISRVRTHLDPERVAYFVQHWSTALPVVVFDVHGELLLADGYHRLAAAQRLGHSSIRADVQKGERRDALRFAVELARQQRGVTEQQVADAIRRRQ